MSSRVAGNAWGEILHHETDAVLEFRHQFGHGVMHWRDDCIIPRYGAAGARKFAFHVPAGFPNTIEAGGKESFEGPAIFPTAWFSERQHALDWFRKA